MPTPKSRSAWTARPDAKCSRSPLRRDSGTGGAPDTFLGGAHQTCRRLVDAGAIGKVVAGTAFLQCHGHESWHPNPAFYYRRGGGPLFDMGPYYLTALVNLLGPVAEVAAFGGRAFDEREITAPAATEKSCKVEVDTHIAAVLRFASGALVNLAMSFDVWKHSLPCIELHGTAGSLSVPDPNCFGGEVRLFQPHLAEWAKLKLTHGYTDNMRGIGAADLAARFQAAFRPAPAENLRSTFSMSCAASATPRGLAHSSKCNRPANARRRCRSDSGTVNLNWRHENEPESIHHLGRLERP